jgi:malate permease and related proteins
MTLFIDILTRVTLPIIALVALGALLQGRLKLDIGTLNRVQVHVVMPCFLVHFLATGKQPLSVVWPVFAFGLVQFLLLIPIGWLTAMLFRQRLTLGPMMGLGTAYANVGFFGIPVTQLAFGAEYLIYQSVMTALMSVMVCTVGVALLAPNETGSGGARFLAKLKTAFETPLIPAVALGLTLRGFQIDLPVVVGQPLQFLGSIFTPLALYTLGAQVAASKITRIEWLPQTLMLVLKFAVAPLLSWGILRFMGFPHDVAGVLIVAAATPVGVLITIFAAEYRNEPEFISTAVVVSTALSPLFVTGWILLAKLY